MRAPQGRPASDLDEMLDLASRLGPAQPTKLDWTDDDSRGDPPVADAAPRLAGSLADTDWAVAATDDGRLQLLIDGRSRGPATRTPTPEEPDIDISYQPIAVPGGLVAYGTAPASVSRIRLRLANGDTATLPTATIAGRSLYAVPIADTLDPTKLEFLASDGAVSGSSDITWLTPYMGGVVSTTTSTT